MIDDLQKLRDSLNQMPVPEPRPGFVDRVLAKATRSEPERASRGIGSMLRWPQTWLAAGAGALVASVVWVTLWLLHTGSSPEPRLVLALHESREIPLVIDSERDLEGATIRLYVSGSIALVGYEEQKEIEWLTSLTQGANLISLPVVAREPGDGRVVAVIEHEGRTRRLSVALHVSAPGDDIA